MYFNLGGLLQTLERWDESITVLRQGLMLDPGCRDIYPYLLYAQMQQCDWENLDALLATVQRINETQLTEGGKVSFTPFALQSLPVDIPLDLRRRVAERISTRLADVAGILPRPARVRRSAAVATSSGSAMSRRISEAIPSPSPSRASSSIMIRHAFPCTALPCPVGGRTR